MDLPKWKVVIVKELEHKMLIQIAKYCKKKKSHFNNSDLWCCTKITALLILTAISALVLKTLDLAKLNLPMYKDVFLKWILLAYGLSSTQQIWTVAELSFFPLEHKRCAHTLGSWLLVHTYTNIYTHAQIHPYFVMQSCFPATREKVLLFVLFTIFGALIIFSNIFNSVWANPLSNCVCDYIFLQHASNLMLD